MHNDPELSGKYLGTLSQDFVQVADTLKDASYQIRKAGFAYPIFPMCQSEQPIGQLLIQPGTSGASWHYYAAYLDEFVQRQLIGADRIKDFEAAYKDPDEFCCLFVIDKTFTNFVFMPYPVD